jgi:hypothetical protein
VDDDDEESGIILVKVPKGASSTSAGVAIRIAIAAFLLQRAMATLGAAAVAVPHPLWQLKTELYDCMMHSIPWQVHQ